MTVDWEKYFSDESKLRGPSVMKMAPRVSDSISFASGLPHPDCFPMKGLAVKYQTPESDFIKLGTASNDDEANAAESDTEIYEACQYMGGRGTTYFDKFSHEYIERFHKPIYKEWDALIQSGGTFSLDAIIRMLCNPGEDTVLAEELTYPCLVESCRPLRIKVFSVKIDEHGVIPSGMDNLLNNWDTNEKTKGHKRPKFFYSMPVGQNPSGVTMTVERKQELFNVCHKHDILVVEDDPYYHLVLDGSDPIPSLLKFDLDGRVIRIDSFSKMLMPGMRISIVTANKTFTRMLQWQNELNIHSAAAPSQLIVYMLMKEWKYEGFTTWIKHIQGLYIKRRDTILDAFDKYLPKELCSWNHPSYGMFIWLNINLAKFPKIDESKSDADWAADVEKIIFDKALTNGIQLAAGHWFMVEHSNMAGFRATYAFASLSDLYKGSERFGNVLREVHDNLYK